MTGVSSCTICWKERKLEIANLSSCSASMHFREGWPEELLRLDCTCILQIKYYNSTLVDLFTTTLESVHLNLILKTCIKGQISGEMNAKIKGEGKGIIVFVPCSLLHYIWKQWLIFGTSLASESAILVTTKGNCQECWLPFLCPQSIGHRSSTTIKMQG